MTIRERILAIFNGEMPDQMPWFADLTYWISGQRKDGTYPKEYDGDEGYLKLHKDLGVGIYLYSPSVYYGKRDETQFQSSPKGEAVGERSEHKKEGDLDIQEIHTPEGTLRTVHRYCPISTSSAFIEYAVKTPDDLRALRCLISAETIHPSFDNFKRIDKLWGEHGIPVLLPPRTPLYPPLGGLGGVSSIDGGMGGHHQPDISRR